MTAISEQAKNVVSQEASGLQGMDSAVLRAQMQSRRCVLIDVREPFEHQAASIAGSILVPLSTVDQAKLQAEHGDKQIVFQCLSGKRSVDAAKRFLKDTGHASAYYLVGGIEAWKQAGLPVERSASAPKLGVMRQVQVMAGGLVAGGTALGVLVNPWFLLVPAGVGCGLMFAGLSGWCGLAKL